MLAGLEAAIEILGVPASSERYEAARRRRSGDLEGAVACENRARMLEGMIKLLRLRHAQEARLAKQRMMAGKPATPQDQEDLAVIRRMIAQYEERDDTPTTGEFPLPWGARRDED